MLSILLTFGLGLSSGANFNSTQVPGPAEVAIWALEDAVADHDAGRDVSGYRYIWIHRKSEQDCIDDARVIDLAPVSMAFSKSANILRSHRVNSRLLRIDLRRLGVTKDSSDRLIATWEKLRDLDHYITAAPAELLVDFVQVTTASDIKVETTTIRQAVAGEELKLAQPSDDPAWVAVEVDGKRAYIAADSVTSPRKGEQRRIGPQCGSAGADLAELLGSDIPIVRHDFLLRNVMHGDIVLRPIGEEGGLYYDFLQIDKAEEGSGQTDLQVFLKAFGADLDESQRLRADVGAIIVRSGVTGRSRAATAFRGRSGRPGASTGVIFLTFDNEDGDDFDPNLDPTENILGFEFKASELIATLPNGTQAYGLFAGNSDGQNQERQDFAPDTVVTDYTVPNPHGKRLVNGMCWRCHNTGEDEDGLKPLGNDLARLLSNGRDILTSDQESADTIASRYGSDFETVLQRSRDDHAAAVYRITRDPVTGEGLEPFEAFGRLSRIYNAYWYELVTPETAMLDLGVVIEDGEDAASAFRELLQVKDIGEASPIVFLASGIAVNRWQWESVYPEAILRAQEFISDNPPLPRKVAAAIEESLDETD